MLKTIVLDCIFISSDLPVDFDGKNSLELISGRISGYDRKILLHRGNINNIPAGIKSVKVESESVSSILHTILDESGNSEFIVVYNCGSPFYDAEFIDSMIERHNEYGADYSNTIGFPDGLTPEIINRKALKQLCTLVEEDETSVKNYLFYAISKDINSFDIETTLCDVDMRLCKIRIGAGDDGERILTANLYRESKDHSYIGLAVFLERNKHLHFTVPYTVIVELTQARRDNSIYFPAVDFDGELSIDLLERIVAQSLRLNSSCRFILGGAGEPSKHTRFFDAVAAIVSKNAELIIETDGLDIDQQFIDKFNEFKDKITIVIRLDAYTPETFKIIRGTDQFELIKAAVLRISDGGFKVYRQVVRIHENELEIEKFIRNKEVDNLIVRKYSSLCGYLPDRSVVDLSPLERNPCFHLRRDIFIGSDGTAPLCYYSRFIDRDSIVTGCNIDEIVLRNRLEFRKQSEGGQRECCRGCKDFYTFNF